MEPKVPARGFDSSKPNIARVYDYLLGGKDNFAADREVAGQVLQIDPRVTEMCRENRDFVTRAVTWAAHQGINQFLDLGSGLPTSPSVHETARQVIPDARVCYVDNDPVAVLHANALLARPDGITAAEADLTRPAAVLANPPVTQVIDTSTPVCLILAAVLHFCDPEQARRITAGYASRLASGSMMVISCLRVDDPAIWEQRQEYTVARVYNHSPDEVLSFFAGLDLVAPGVASAHAWRAGMPMVPAKPPGALYDLCGVGVKSAGLSRHSA